MVGNGWSNSIVCEISNPPWDRVGTTTQAASFHSYAVPKKMMMMILRVGILRQWQVEALARIILWSHTL